MSNNVWAPQIALPGSNTSDIVATANRSESNGIDSDTTYDGAAPPPKRPLLDAVRSTLNTVTGTTERPVLDAIAEELPRHTQLGDANTVNYTANSGGSTTRRSASRQRPCCNPRRARTGASAGP